jgi:peptide deformylase
MGLLVIRKFGDKVLKKKAKKIKKIDDQIIKLAHDMAETMRLGQGVGLAANQVGALKRIIVIEADFENRRVLALINPKIVRKSREKNIDKEGCLSFPDVYLNIKRSNKVKVKAKNIKGEKVSIEADGLLARALQHEIDHLNGVLFYQRLSPIKRISFKIKHRV